MTEARVRSVPRRMISLYLTTPVVCEPSRESLRTRSLRYGSALDPGLGQTHLRTESLLWGYCRESHTFRGGGRWSILDQGQPEEIKQELKDSLDQGSMNGIRLDFALTCGSAVPTKG